MSKEAAPDYTLNNSDVITKYKAAGDIASKILEELKTKIVEGAKVYDLTVEGDKRIGEEVAKTFNSKKNSVSKGIAFPTTVSVNNCAAHLSPLSPDDESNITLKNGDVAKVQLGVQIDGFASIVSETVVVGGLEQAKGKVADAIAAAYYATEAALRTFKPGKKNWDVTSIVDKVAAEFGVKPLEGMLTHNQERNVLTGPNEVIINPTESQKASVSTVSFEEGQVYGLDILISTGEGKVKQGDTKTTIFKPTGNTYQLKLRTSRATFSEVQNKAGKFPFSVRILDDAKKARMGLHECQSHELITAYDVMYEKEGEVIAQFYTTFGITKNGILLFAAPKFDISKLNTDKAIQDEEIKELLTQPLKTNKKSNKKKPAAKESA